MSFFRFTDGFNAVVLRVEVDVEKIQGKESRKFAVDESSGKFSSGRDAC